MPMACAIFTPRICAPRSGSVRAQAPDGACAQGHGPPGAPWPTRRVVTTAGEAPVLFSKDSRPSLTTNPLAATHAPAGAGGRRAATGPDLRPWLATHEAALEPTGIAQWEYAAKDGVRGHAMCLRQRSHSIIIWTHLTLNCRCPKCYI